MQADNYHQVEMQGKSSDLWHAIRLRQRQFVSVAILVPLGLLCLILASLRWTVVGSMVAVIASGGAVIVIASYAYFIFAPCPRCRHAFFTNLIFTNPFAQQCLNCGQKKYSPIRASEGDSQQERITRHASEVERSLKLPDEDGYEPE